ncbi:MAG: hypothetical protein KF912_07145 [Phycisphaeraceae bacterium]|nr:hypothetical protein [Phycisphaeraceae bacterium]
MVAHAPPTPTSTTPNHAHAPKSDLTHTHLHRGTDIDALLNDVLSPNHSLTSAAAKHNLPLEALTLWLALPETRARLAAMDEAGSAHVRTVASLNLSTSVHTLVQIMADFRALAAARSANREIGSHSDTPPDPDDIIYLRASIHARKAAWLLYQLSRSGTPSARKAAHTSLPLGGSALRADSAPAGTTPDGTTPGGTALQSAVPVPPSDLIPPAPEPLSPSAPEPPSPSAPVPLSPSAPSSSTTPASHDDVITALAALANSLGLTPDDLEGLTLDDLPDDGPLPPEALALFPPDVAAYLAALPHDEPQPPDLPTHPNPSQHAPPDPHPPPANHLSTPPPATHLSTPLASGSESHFAAAH